ncbi:uncharacterized protein LOC144799793 isoform X3 [Lissotriton helveticus]
MEDQGTSLLETESQQVNLLFDTAFNTLLAVTVYVVVKISVDRLRQWRAKMTLLIVGAGPVGLTAALVAVRSHKVLKLTVMDSRARAALLCRPQQIALDPRSVQFLLPLGVDFDNIEGCWHNDHFYTKIGVFQEHLLSILEKKKQIMDIHILLGTKVPTPEIRAHSLYFDLSAYGVGISASSKESLNTQQPAMKSGFHLKIYGTFRNRYMALACPTSDSKVVRFLRHTTNSLIMKNIFHQSFNAYKADIEPRVNDLALHHLQCSRKLFEVMLSHRKATAAYIEGDNIAVAIEGEAARVLNFDTVRISMLQRLEQHRGRWIHRISPNSQCGTAGKQLLIKKNPAWRHRHGNLYPGSPLAAAIQSSWVH